MSLTLGNEDSVEDKTGYEDGDEDINDVDSNIDDIDNGVKGADISDDDKDFNTLEFLNDGDEGVNIWDELFGMLKR